MTQKEFIKKVREITSNTNFNFWHVEHFIKSGLINPKQHGQGIPREFTLNDLNIVVKRILGK
ncbi:MAG: hypothetical protein ACTSWK_07435 [Promethearchaeota archaeon]